MIYEINLPVEYIEIKVERWDFWHPRRAHLIRVEVFWKHFYYSCCTSRKIHENEKILNTLVTKTSIRVTWVWLCVINCDLKKLFDAIFGCYHLIIYFENKHDDFSTSKVQAERVSSRFYLQMINKRFQLLSLPPNLWDKFCQSQNFWS